jgi:hypothetical protein
MRQVEGLEIRESGVEGYGCYTTRAFAAGEVVVRQEGWECATADLPPGALALQIGPDRWLCGDEEDLHPSDVINHGCEPNLAFVEGSLTLAALRDLAPGEELCFDYLTAMDLPGWSFACACGAPTCRGRVTGWSDAPSALREARRPWALAWLAALR